LQGSHGNSPPACRPQTSHASRGPRSQCSNGSTRTSWSTRSKPRGNVSTLSDVLAKFWPRADSDAARIGQEKPRYAGLFNDGAYRDRTGDLRLAKPALSQLS